MAEVSTVAGVSCFEAAGAQVRESTAPSLDK
jgi:hypothetical protein